MKRLKLSHLLRLSSPVRSSLLTASLVVCAGLVGCSSQPNAFSRRNAMTASLKDNINQLEIEKSRLETQVADLSTENRRLEDRLVREEAHSADLAERLDDTKRISRSGRSSNLDSSTAGLDPGWDDQPTRRTTPANAKPQRRVPVAQIPGDLEPLDDRSRDDFSPRSRSRATPLEDEPGDSDLFTPAGDLEASRSRYGNDRDLWLPIARQDSANRR